MSFGSNAGMETIVPLVDGIVNNALFHYISHTNQLPLQISFTSCTFSGRLDAPDFVINWIEVRAVWLWEICKFIQVFYISALSDWMQQIMHRMLA